MTLLHCCVEQGFLLRLSQGSEQAQYTEADSEIHSHGSHSGISEHAVGGPALIVSIYAFMFALWI